MRIGPNNNNYYNRKKNEMNFFFHMSIKITWFRCRANQYLFIITLSSSVFCLSVSVSFSFHLFLYSLIFLELIIMNIMMLIMLPMKLLSFEILQAQYNRMDTREIIYFHFFLICVHACSLKNLISLPLLWETNKQTNTN